MVYPDTFEGFMVKSHENWSDFQKKEVKFLQHMSLGLKSLSLIYSSSLNRDSEIAIGLKATTVSIGDMFAMYARSGPGKPVSVVGIKEADQKALSANGFVCAKGEG
ncbi:NADPH-dependent medium chain alcohol dehydrogenase [Penicillium angulare]|uniref:NADPH-dependent medium chain alcohol dehydrogenase n=1 Tax=Penicillium angulare TaxID=116970 RepID=A0A9W9FWA0_9EURO|nr:NADPH-dependent medium chain alcohol dehydrogenase [Penicillium angulare]